MAIPNVNAFNEFLSSLSLDPPEQDSEYHKFELIPPRYQSAGNHFGVSKPVWAWYKKECEITLSAVIEKVQKELHQRGHDSTAEVAKTLIAVYCLKSGTRRMPVEKLNSIFELILPAEVSQFLIAPFPPHPDSKPYSMGRFIFGPLNRERLKYRCEKVKCDYFVRNPHAHVNSFAIEGTPVNVRILDWDALAEDFDIEANSMALDTYDNYFTNLTLNLRGDFYEEIRKAEEVAVAAGAPYLELDRPEPWMGGAFICVFMNFGKSKTGYFCPLGMSVQIDYAQADKRMPAKEQELKQKYSFSGYLDSEIHTALSSFCRFVVKGRVFEGHGKIEEALLHYIIAIDLLLGEKDASNQKISKRAAIISAGPLGRNFSSVVDTVRSLYDKRSRYVHSGISIDVKDLASVHPIKDAILHALLRLQSQDENLRKQNFVSDWLKTLDYLIAATEAGKTLRDEEFKNAGIEVGSTER